MAEDPEDADLFNAGMAFARQALLEARIGLRVQAMLQAFLTDVRSIALRDDVQIAPSRVERAWADALARYVTPHFEDRVLEYVVTAREGLAHSDIPERVYTAVNETLESRRRQGFAVDDVPAMLDEVLFGIERSMTAGAQTFARRRVSIGKDVLDPSAVASPAAKRFLDTIGAPPPTPREVESANVDEEPSETEWVHRARLATKMLATGLDGSLTQWRLVKAQVPFKEWVSRHDDKVRPTHLAADGQTVKTRSTFTVGGEPMRYPGDRNAAIGETANCRCVMIGKRSR